MEYSFLPPFLKKIVYRPYPEGYRCLQFILFDELKSGPKEHISCYIDALGQYVVDS